MLESASKELEKIAKDILNLETLATRNSDSLDFSDQAVWHIKQALELAYLKGQADVLAITENPK